MRHIYFERRVLANHGEVTVRAWAKDDEADMPFVIAIKQRTLHSPEKGEHTTWTCIAPDFTDADVVREAIKQIDGISDG